mmetsp:Transcript_13411/g.36871  ORF Transcript_13411/g.36871 Transcript_13411/m.36871 type:complete len:280 (-) Transcript_13411:2-841(-)
MWVRHGVVCALIVYTAAQDTDAWDRALKKHVYPSAFDEISHNRVNYTAMSADPDFHEFVSSLDHVKVEELNKSETIALFMNAYNAFAMKMIVDHACKRGFFLRRCEGPIGSIKDIGFNFFGPVSSVWFRFAGRIGGRRYSLQKIEDFLRTPTPYSEDARLHACIVCASISCPNVRAEAYRAESLDAQMTSQMQSMLQNDKKGYKLDRPSGVLTLSRIFQWYGGDFKAAAGTVVNFVLPFVSSDDRIFLSNAHNVTIQYFDYDWRVNGDPPCECTPWSTV